MSSESPGLSPAEREGIEWNRASWDARVEAHWESAMYRAHAEALRAGRHDLAAHVVEGVGDVRGQRLIHLQCHMGMETLGWATLGAEAVGVDFSRPAIDKAERMRDELGLDARFVCCPVYDAPQHVDGGFDVVFASVGSLCWLPDVPRWAAVVAQLLTPGGRLFLEDTHPLIGALEDVDGEPGFALRGPYLGGQRLVYEDDGTYASDASGFAHNKMAEWVHSVGDVVTAVVEAGLRVERLEESDRCVWPALRAMEQTRPGWWELPEPYRGKYPMTFTLTARK